MDLRWSASRKSRSVSPPRWPVIWRKSWPSVAAHHPGIKDIALVQMQRRGHFLCICTLSRSPVPFHPGLRSASEHANSVRTESGRNIPCNPRSGLLYRKVWRYRSVLKMPPGPTRNSSPGWPGWRNSSGAFRIRLADTVGLATPVRIISLVKEIKRVLDQM